MKNAVLRFLNKAIIAYIEMKNAPRRGGGVGVVFMTAPLPIEKEPLSYYGFTCTIAAAPESLLAKQASWGSSGKLHELKFYKLNLRLN